MGWTLGYASLWGVGQSLRALIVRTPPMSFASTYF